MQTMEQQVALLLGKFGGVTADFGKVREKKDEEN